MSTAELNSMFRANFPHAEVLAEIEFGGERYAIVDDENGYWACERGVFLASLEEAAGDWGAFVDGAACDHDAGLAAVVLERTGVLVRWDGIGEPILQAGSEVHLEALGAYCAQCALATTDIASAIDADGRSLLPTSPQEGDCDLLAQHLGEDPSEQQERIFTGAYERRVRATVEACANDYVLLQSEEKAPPNSHTVVQIDLVWMRPDDTDPGWAVTAKIEHAGYIHTASCGLSDDPAADLGDLIGLVPQATSREYLHGPVYYRRESLDQRSYGPRSGGEGWRWTAWSK